MQTFSHMSKMPMRTDNRVSNVTAQIAESQS